MSESWADLYQLNVGIIFIKCVILLHVQAVATTIFSAKATGGNL